MSMTIKMKQTQLQFLGYYNGRVDGLWGNNSIKATREFQSENKLAVDGMFGPDCEKKSMEIVRSVQNVVKKYNSSLVVDGLAGNVTMAAVRQYQKDNGLNVTGIANSETRKAMKISSGNTAVTPNPPTNNKPSTGDWWDTIKYFKKDEFKCHCGGRYCNGFPYSPEEKLIRAADKVREHFGKPITVSSGVRCTKHNASVGGVYNSRHLTGKAMDFCVRGVSANTVLNYVKTLPEIRYSYCINENYVHMDVL